MKRILLAAVACFALISGAMAQTVSVTPGAGALTLAPATNGTNGPGAVIGTVGCLTDPPGGACGAPAVTLSGADATRFRLTNGSLTIGPAALASGKYVVVLQRGAAAVPYTITVVAPPPPPPGGFIIGQQVVTSAAANVRQTAAGTLLGAQTAGAGATVIGGPTAAVLAGTSYTWWNLNFATGVDGWVAGDNLKAVGVSGPPPPPPPPAGTCVDDDGAAGAPAGAPNYPAMLAGYKATPHDVGCKVAGVDFHAGVPDGLTLKDPTTALLPTGCVFDKKRTVNCNGTVAIDGYDFGLHGTLLGGSGKVTVKDSRFVFGPDCTDPVIRVSGSLSLIANTIDGTTGIKCPLNQGFGTFVATDLNAGSAFVAKYNLLINIVQDGFDINAGNSGTATTDIQYNVVWREGYSGHPDFLQWCGGGATVVGPNVVKHNTYFNDTFPGNTAGIQPLHVEAQICTGPGHLDHSTVALNTVIGKGSCKGGNDWPNGCSINFSIACKLDDKTSSNDNFVAYGNYIDISGGIRAFANDGCPGVVWGKPLPNVDMLSGAALPAN